MIDICFHVGIHNSKIILKPLTCQSEINFWLESTLNGKSLGIMAYLYS